MPIRKNFFHIVIKVLIVLFGLMSFSVNSKEAWVDDAIAFAEQLKDIHNSNGTRTVDEIELELSNLTPLKRLEAYQQLSFMYLVEFRVEDYQALKAAYSPLLSQLNDNNRLDMQLVLDVLEATTFPEKIDEAIITIESLIKSNILSDEAHILAHVVNVYSRNIKRNTPQSINAIRRAKNAYALSEKSTFAGLSLELASAFTSLNIYDYAQANKSTQTGYAAIQEFEYLYFNIDNYLANLSWMLRQSNELEHAININNWQLGKLTKDSNKSFAFYTYFGCGVYQQMYGDFEQSVNCLLSAKKFLEYAPERWESWYAAIVISAVMADRVELAKQYFAEYMNDPRAKKELSPLSKLRLGMAYLDIENGETKKAIEALNTYHVNNASRQTTSFRSLAMQYNTFIDNEIKALEKNVSLQTRLLNQQRVLNGIGIAIIIGLVIFTIILLKNRRKQRILATHDSLTRMYNRRGFLEVFPKILDKAKREGTSLALGVIDIDRFKAINEVNGHAVGDEVLNSIAKRIKEFLGKDIVAGRMGGDEFAVILPNIKDHNELKEKGVALCEFLNSDIHVSNISLKPSVSIGFSSYPDAGRNIQQLVDCADFALYSCKQFERGSARIFSPCDQSSLEARRNLEAALANAKDEEFTLEYQAIIDAHTEQVKGFEALARWHSSELGLVSPADFIPVAERTGYINRISRLLLTKALAEAATWPPHITLSFNLSSQDVNSLENAQSIKQIILESPFPSDKLIAEMTETAIIQDTNTTREALRLLTNIGVSVALDDFGTGYSSINHLLDFEFERIKLDRVLIDSIEEDRNKFEIVQTLVDLCHNLKIDCVIEGVETKVQKEQLLKMKVDKFQGYLFSKPIPPDEIQSFLANNN